MLTSIKSFGYRTDSMILSFDGSILEKDEYFVISSPDNPGHFWGNFLLYKKPPEVGDRVRWQAAFKQEFTSPNIHHMTFGWDDPSGRTGASDEFVDAGFTLEQSIVLTTNRVTKPRKFHTGAEVRPLQGDEEFAASIKLQVACAGAHLAPTTWEEFYRKAMPRYRKMIAQDLGHWYGAFLDGQLVGSLGIFCQDGVGRFQAVGTHPQHQRQGVCSTLVYESARHCMQSFDTETLVMVADEAYHAAKIYESVGFRPTEKQVGLCWWDKTIHS